MVLHASPAFVPTCFTCLLTCYVYTYVPTHVTDVPYVNACLRAFVSYVPSFFPFFLSAFLLLSALRPFIFLRAFVFYVPLVFYVPCVP